jgi:diguanylate cyclase (GGDEF)-like protein
MKAMQRMELTDLQARNVQILALLRDGQQPMPSPSAVALELMRAVERRDVGVFEICRVARNDPMLVAKSVQMANSALYAGLRQTAAMEDAVMRIGVAALARLAIGLSLVHASSTWVSHFDLNQHWRCALARGLVLQHLARRLRNLPSSEAFSMGLLSDIGELGMVAAFGIEAEKTPDEPVQPRVQRLMHQRQRWGFDQNQASAALLEGWGFPASLWLAALPIAQETAHNAGRGGELALMVDVARCLASELCSPAAGAELPRLCMGAARLGLEPEDLVVMLDMMRAEFPSLASILDIAMPGEQAAVEFQRLRTALTASPPLDDSIPDSVLVIDDQVEQRELLRHVLLAAGLPVLTAANAAQGLEILRSHQPRMVIIDWQLLGLNGLELCRQLRYEFGSRLYVLLLMGHHDSQEALEAIEAGANDFITKPADHKLLVAKIRVGGRTTRLLAALENERHEAFGMQRELARLNANLRAAAYTDDLTGLPNRRALDEFLHKAWADAGRNHQPLSCVILDLDHFKLINDQHGHDVGDRVLRAVTQVLRTQTRFTDLLARWGGEELVLACPNTDAPAARLLAERMRLTIATLHGDFPPVTLSAGIAETCPGDADVGILLRAADQALLLAKRKGRNRVELAAARGIDPSRG